MTRTYKEMEQEIRGDCPDPTPQEKVEHPDHYTVGGIEVIDILKAKLSAWEYRGFLLGNVLKYLMRSNYKNGTEDIHKAHFYLSLMVKEME